MQIIELRQLLSTLESLLSQAQASKSAISDLQRLNTCLGQFDELSVAQFCKKCDLLIGSREEGAATRSTINEAAVTSYLNELSRCGSDRAQFEGVLAKLKADKNLRIGEINAIAQGYVGGTSKYKKKVDAFRDISLRFDAHMSGVQRLAASSEIF